MQIVLTKTFHRVRMVINILVGGLLGLGVIVVAVVAGLRRIVRYRVSIGELIVIGLVVGTPYLLVGLVWSSTHTEHLQHMPTTDAVVSFLGSIVSWPVLLFADVCMT
jgi:hypothetical protein